MRSLALLSIAPVKGLRLVHPTSVDLGPDGIPADRRFLLVAEGGALIGATERPQLMQIVPDYDPVTERLRLAFPDGTSIEGDADRTAEELEVDVWKRRATGRRVLGPFDDALSTFVGRAVRVVRVPDAAGQDAQPLTLVSSASIAEIGAQGGDELLDGRRFRMNLEIGGAAPYEEDAWSGDLVRIGEATIRVGDQVPRCIVTTLDPDTGEKDFRTLNVIARHRPRIGPRAGLPFGMYAEVVEPGRVSVGDAVEPIRIARSSTATDAGP
jgi:hypothetical protein